MTLCLTLAEGGSAFNAGVIRALEVSWRADFGRGTIRGVSSTLAIVGALVGETRIGTLPVEGLEAVLLALCGDTFILVLTLDHGIGAAKVVFTALVLVSDTAPCSAAKDRRLSICRAAVAARLHALLQVRTVELSVTAAVSQDVRDAELISTWTQERLGRGYIAHRGVHSIAVYVG